MSGTSLDGVDVALCEITATQCKLLHYEEYPFVSSLKTKILRIIHSSTTLKEIGVLNQELGSLFADAVCKFLKSKNITASTIEAIGLHGQTLWHEPHGEFAFSMQLGCPNSLASKTNIKTVTDFRQMDIANGGEGAPFAPAFHQFIFASDKKRAIINIGGMANITLLGDTLKGWDSGCGNVLLDIWMSKTQNTPYDKNGRFSKSGEINQVLLDAMTNDAYFKKEPPKSTGREYFNEDWLNKHLKALKKQISLKDVARTLLELTALSIANDVKDKNLQELIICGGGSKNTFLMQRLQELSGVKSISSDTFGLSADALEAMAFSWFAYKRVNQEPVNLCSVTGAKKASLLGGIYE